MIIWKVLNLNFNEKFPMHCCMDGCHIISVENDLHYHYVVVAVTVANVFSSACGLKSCNANMPEKNRFSIYFLSMCDNN